MTALIHSVVTDSAMPHGEIGLPKQIFPPDFFLHHSIITLQIGRTQFKLPINISASAAELICNKATAKQMFLYPGMQLRLYFDLEKKILRIGPVVGIISNEIPDPAKPFAKQSLFFKELQQEAKGLACLCYVFSARGINYEKKYIAGYIYENETWQKRIFPFPDVVYPREPGISRASKLTRQNLENVGCVYLNPVSIDKWQMYKALQQDKILSEYLPETKLAGNFETVADMLEKYLGIYLKPVNGTQGRSIIRIKKQSDPVFYQYEFSANGVNYRMEASSLPELKRKLYSQIRKRKYLVQQQIDLLKLKNRLTDIRILVQKDGQGEWSVTGKVFRVGQKGCVTSNISSGGFVNSVESMLEEFFPDPVLSRNLAEEIEFLALTVAKELEKHFGLICELGIDIGLDQKGRLWLIEANIKPGRRVFLLNKDQAARRASIKKPILYAIHASGFEGSQR